VSTAQETGTGTTATPDFAQRLYAWIAAETGGRDATLVNLRPVGLGRSRENWVFDLVSPGADGTDQIEPLIVRTDPDGGLVDTDRSTEFAVLRALEHSTLPTPAVRWLDATGEHIGRPGLVMRRASGVCDYRIVNGPLPLDVRIDLARQFCDLLAQVHGVDWADLGLGAVLADPGPEAARFELDRWEQVLRTDQLEAYPELDLALLELRDWAPRTSRTVLVHADFKPGNILLEDNRVACLLDWELAHLGDPLEDVGWVTQPLRTREHLIAGAWEADDLIARYEQVSGTHVDRLALQWWQIFSTLKTAIMQVSGLRAFLEGRSDEPYRPNRRVLSTLLDALSGSN
jgi:aminoglycoside phosphotransferase (APT) family kinase protein